MSFTLTQNRYIMSLGIVFKGPEGIVLAADSRVTINAEKRISDTHRLLLPSTFDNATKLLKVNGHDYVGAVTYGLGAIGINEPRTAHSFLPEFEVALSRKEKKRFSVEEFSKELSDFFMGQWKEMMPPDYKNDPLIFLIGGYDEGAPYGKVFQMILPYEPAPQEQSAGQGVFGITWGGQHEILTRILSGYDPNLTLVVKDKLNLSDEQKKDLDQFLQPVFNLPIPYQFLPLQDCVDLSIFLIRTTIELQKWMIGIRGVGGVIDVATITRTGGFQYVQRKEIKGDRYA
jgi:hypothetical protein